MRYFSTRNSNNNIGHSFKYILFSNLCENGGLYIPCEIPKIIYGFDIKKNMNFYDIAFIIFRKYISSVELNDEDLYIILKKSFEKFKHEKIIPLRKLDKSNINILELFWGPTYSFKDIALCVIGNLFEHFLNSDRNNTRKNINIICATSGDTGSAAIHSFYGKQGIRCCVLHPHEKISNIQKQQMTTILDQNIINLAVKGSFDDCQRIVKNLLYNFNFISVNSINWSRILTQITYYFYSYIQWLDDNNLEWGELINYSVPTGNFGDILAGYYAKQMGLPIDKLIIATNKNDTLYRFLQNGIFEPKKVNITQSPAMDISIPSNFERLLYHATFNCNDSRDDTCCLINFQMRQNKFQVSQRILEEIKKDFVCRSITDTETEQMITKTYSNDKYIIDPHTAIGISAYYKWRQYKNYEDEDLNMLNEHQYKNNIICLSTAHPAKFPDTILKCIDTYDFIPDDLLNLEHLPQKYDIIDNDSENVLKYF